MAGRQGEYAWREVNILKKIKASPYELGRVSTPTFLVYSLALTIFSNVMLICPLGAYHRNVRHHRVGT